jgi:hypothetical protein
LFDQYLENVERRNSTIIVVNHYPTKFVTPLSFEALLERRNVLARLSGHAHAKQFYINDAGRLLDLELADVKIKQMYRVAAFDNGLLSFVDTDMHAPLVSFVTMPKAAAFQSAREPLAVMRRSPSIRLVAMAANARNVTRVTLRIDDDPLVHTLVASDIAPHMFVLAWNATRYATGLHSLHVTVVGDDGSQLDYVHRFSLDGAKPFLGFAFIRMLCRQNLRVYAIVGSRNCLLTCLFTCSITTMLAVVPLCYILLLLLLPLCVFKTQYGQQILQKEISIGILLSLSVHSYV